MEIKGLKVVHALPGRVRLKVAKVKGNPALARRAEKKLAKVPGIKQVEAKSDTGSLLIHYDMEDLFSMASMEILSETLGELFPEIEVVTLAAWLASLAEGPGAGTGTGRLGHHRWHHRFFRGRQCRGRKNYRRSRPQTPGAPGPDLSGITRAVDL